MFKIKQPARLDQLRSLLEFVRDCSEKYGFPQDKSDEICLAAEELLVNIITYAYPDQPGEIEVACDCREGRTLIIRIADWGAAFDPCTANPPALDGSLADRAQGGMGIFLAKNLMDEVKYRRRGRRNETTLIKNKTE